MTQTIQVDGRFPDHRTEKLATLLEQGWQVLDKTIVGDRYVTYILTEPVTDLQCSEPKQG